LVRLVCEEAGDTPVWVCGELAGRPETVPVLLRLGVRNLSVAPPLLPGVRNAVRQVDLRRDDS
jgi:phosphoenolpyruvate-protein kinase (PTS system EI component)